MSGSVLKGVVINNSSEKTVAVLVSRKVWHKMYRKMVKLSKKYLVHDECNKCCVGDSVHICSSIPISARKKWVIVND